MRIRIAQRMVFMADDEKNTKNLFTKDVLGAIIFTILDTFKILLQLQLQITSDIADTADIIDIIDPVEIVGNDDTHPLSNMGFTLRYAHASENMNNLHSQVSPLALKLFHAMPTS